MKLLQMRTLDLPWNLLLKGSYNVPYLPEVERHFRRLQWLRPALFALFVLNTMDGLLTILWLQKGLATEANPMMAQLIDTHPALFMLGKLLLVFLGSMLLLRYYYRGSAVVGVVFLNVFYSGLMLYHFQGVVLLLR